MFEEISVNIQDLPHELTLDLKNIAPNDYESILESLKGLILYNSRYLDESTQDLHSDDIAVDKLHQEGDSLTIRIALAKKAGDP